MSRQSPAVNNSRLEWFGDVPDHWGAYPLKYLADLKSGTAIDSSSIGPTGMYPVYGGNGLRGYTDTFTHDGTYVLIGRQGAQCGNTHFVNGQFWASEHAVVVTPKKEINVSWLGQLLGAMNLNQYSISAAQPGLSVDFICNLRVPVPPHEEQDAIATFLHRRTNTVEEVIRKKQRLIELLQEKRQALITQAVTKGLDPSVPMKDSGIEWLGEIPAHWNMVRLKHVTSPKKDAIKTGPFGSQLTSQDMSDTAIKVYNQRTVLDNDFDCGENYISEDKFVELQSFRVYAGDVLVTTRGTIGRTAIVPETAELGILHPCLMRVQVDQRKIDSRLLALQIQDGDFVARQLKTMSNATTIDVIYSGTLKNVMIPVPPLNEQHQILEVIGKRTRIIDQTISRIEHQIDRLNEYRQTLISAAVTGKIDVREEVAACL